MGDELLVTTEDDTCASRVPGAACENKMVIYLPRRGVLARAAEIPVERIDYIAAAGERAASGKLEYHLTSVAEYRSEGIHLVEQIRVKDDAGRELRKAELERMFTLTSTGELKPNEPPLWDRVTASETRPATETEAAPRHLHR